MAFDQIRNKTPRTKGKCSLCKTRDKVGTLGVAVRDKDTKVVASRSVGVCEKCGTEGYEKALGAIGA